MRQEIICKNSNSWEKVLRLERVLGLERVVRLERVLRLEREEGL